MNEYNEASCEVKVVHDDVVEKVKKTMISDEILNDMGNIFKVIGDLTRLKILHTLLEYELCVCDICELLNMTPSAISHQMKVLKNARMVKSRRSGKNMFYSLDDNHVKELIKVGLVHVSEDHGKEV